jgi:hypothetical protein
MDRLARRAGFSFSELGVTNSVSCFLIRTAVSKGKMDPRPLTAA